MPEESKKKQQKGRSDAKDQRRPRNRHQAGPTEKINDRKNEEPKVPTVQKPLYEEPGPEFYKGLKRETDEILKITEDADSKYKKKEIQSNWSKYELPIESYDEIEEQENMGADYEKLIEAPLSVGGHFQFKHEKTWDTDTAPSLYDKYFEVNMDNLFVSVSTIPFYERINVDKTIFSETDTLSMNNRATRFKQKYYKDKTFTTPEMTAQNNFLSILKENIEDGKDSIAADVCSEATEEEDIKIVTNENIIEKHKEMNVIEIPENLNECKVERIVANNSTNEKKENLKLQREKHADLDNIDDLIKSSHDEKSQELKDEKIEVTFRAVIKEDPAPVKPEPGAEKNPIIESPEDLEKWLDDFLDG